MNLYTELTTHWPLLLVAIGFLLLLFKGPLSRKLAGVQEISPQQAVQLINQEDALVIDVREQHEWSKGHLANAKHIPIGDLQKYLQDLHKHKERHVICQCASGMRSLRAAGILHRAGFSRVYSLKGGIQAWRSAGLPVHKG